MQGKPCCDGTCQGNGHVQKQTPSVRMLYALADEMGARADGMREITNHKESVTAMLFDKLAAFFLRCGAYADEWDVDIDDLKPTAGGPDAQTQDQRNVRSLIEQANLAACEAKRKQTTDARWLAAQADEYAKQQGRQEQEAASLLRAASFLCAARGASLENLHVVVERGM